MYSIFLLCSKGKESPLGVYPNASTILIQNQIIYTFYFQKEIRSMTIFLACDNIQIE